MTNPVPIYNPNIPQRKNTLADSQIDFLNNFSTLYTAFMANHIPLDAVSGAGNHTNVQMFEQQKNDQFQTNVDEISVYCKNVEGQTDQIFLRYQGNQDEFQFSTYQIYSLPVSTVATRFFTFLPGNVIIFFGTAQVKISTSGFPLKLVPSIAKNIITVNLCPLGLPNIPPFVTVPPVNKNKIITNINLFPNPGSIPGIGIGFPTDLFFFVMANI